MPILPSERTVRYRYRSNTRASIATTPNQTHGGWWRGPEGHTTRPAASGPAQTLSSGRHKQRSVTTEGYRTLHRQLFATG